MQRKPKNKAQPRPPTLRPTLYADSRQAWRQSEDAVILPIIYILADSAEQTDALDCDIIQINQASPSLQDNSTEFAHLPDKELSNEDDRIKKFALLKSKVGSVRAGVSLKLPAKIDDNTSFFIAPETALSSKAGHLSIAVPLLLLGVIALVLFAWATFR